MKEFKFKDNRLKVMLNGVECAAEAEAVEAALRKCMRIAEKAKTGDCDAEELFDALAKEIDKLFGEGCIDKIFDGAVRSAFNMADLITFLSEAYSEHVKEFAGKVEGMNN